MGFKLHSFSELSDRGIKLISRGKGACCVLNICKRWDWELCVGVMWMCGCGQAVVKSYYEIIVVEEKCSVGVYQWHRKKRTKFEWRVCSERNALTSRNLPFLRAHTHTHTNKLTQRQKHTDTNTYIYIQIFIEKSYQILEMFCITILTKQDQLRHRNVKQDIFYFFFLDE